MTPTAGYSGTPLVRKLGFKPGMRVMLISTPDHYVELLGDEAAQLELVERARTKVDAVHAFFTEADALDAAIAGLRAAIVPNGMIWISWPKKAAKVPTDITEDVIRAIALRNGLVDVKVCAIDAVWSGLKLVIPLDLRKP